MEIDQRCFAPLKSPPDESAVADMTGYLDEF